VIDGRTSNRLELHLIGSDFRLALPLPSAAWSANRFVYSHPLI
jgi:hypothetical protein